MLEKEVSDAAKLVMVIITTVINWPLFEERMWWYIRMLQVSPVQPLVCEQSHEFGPAQRPPWRQVALQTAGGDYVRHETMCFVLGFAYEFGSGHQSSPASKHSCTPPVNNDNNEVGCRLWWRCLWWLMAWGWWSYCPGETQEAPLKHGGLQIAVGHISQQMSLSLHSRL